MSKTFWIILAIVVGLMVGGFWLTSRGENNSTVNNQTGAAQVVRANSHKLDSAADNKVTLVEFLDFECEACGANFPIIERIREEYKGKINFYIRYFPLAGHKNARPAARAVEAAFEQGKGEDMYKLMYENQENWGEKPGAEATFKKFAEQLGLDMDKFNEAAGSNRVAERIEFDVKDGKELNVDATPTFFFNEEKLKGGQKYEALKAKIDAALAKN